MENKKIFFTAEENGDLIIKTGENFKKENEQFIVESEKNIKEIDQLIKEIKIEIVRQQRLIFKLNKSKENNLENRLVDLEKAKDHLWFLRKELQRNISLKKRISSLLGKSILSKIDVSFKLKELEKINLEFKENLLTIFKRSDN